jgi:hypothetical protein
MPSHRLAFTALAFGCLIAAGTGGYLAMRWGGTPARAIETEPAPSAVAPQPLATDEGAPAHDKGSDRSARALAPSNAPATKRLGTQTHRLAPAAAAQSNAVAARARTEPATPADRGAPGISGSSPVPGSAGITPLVVPPPSDEHLAQVEPAPKPLEEIVIPAESVIGLQSETVLSSDDARVEDRVEARVTRDVRVGDQVAIPAGVRAIGSVIQVERGGKFKERARLGIRFHTLVLADGTRLPITTEAIYRDGAAPGNKAAAKVGGGAVAGTILGAILGGGKGAAIGAASGAAAGSGAVLAGERSNAALRPGEPMTVRILAPITVTIQK